MRRRILRRVALAVAMLPGAVGAAAAQEFAGREKLRAHTAEFRQDVIEVTNGVWVAVGYSHANAVLIDGDGGSIIVDTTSDVGGAAQVKAEFAQRSTAPVRAIIYTHAHPDHTGGASVFAGSDNPTTRRRLLQGLSHALRDSRRAPASDRTVDR